MFIKKLKKNYVTRIKKIVLWKDCVFIKFQSYLFELPLGKPGFFFQSIGLS